MNARMWKSWLVPGGLMLAVAAVLVNSSLFVQIAPSLAFYYIAVFVAGLLLAWRFNSSRVLFSLLVLLLAHRAVEFFSAGQPRVGPGRMAVSLAAVLIPLNFIAFAWMRERGLIVAGIAPRFGLLFVESVVVAVLCRPENSPAPAGHPVALTMQPWLLLSSVAGVGVFVWRFFHTRKPIEPGFAWSVVGVLLWLQFAPIGKMSDAYVATAALILGASLIETSYVLAYHDELTGIRGRRAFNESLLSLDQQYAIAIVDIDHFKKFNDTYGHDVGDQVLCMVASRLSHVGGDGQAFRCGGEEFAIIFRNTSATEAWEHLESLRWTIEQSVFHLRGADRRAAAAVRRAADRQQAEETNTSASRSDDRRSNDRRSDGRRTNDRRTPSAKSDRRRSPRKKSLAAPAEQGQLFPAPPAPHAPPASDHLSVTVSIGVAEPSTRNRQPEQVIQAADQALYRAKNKGRNRVEPAAIVPLQLAAGKRVGAPRL